MRRGKHGFGSVIFYLTNPGLFEILYRNIYFRLRLSLVNTIHVCLRLKLHVGWGGNFSLKCVLIELDIPNLSLFFLLYKMIFFMKFKTVTLHLKVVIKC